MSEIAMATVDVADANVPPPMEAECLDRGDSEISANQLAVYVLLATASMLFAGFASAYLVRRQGLDWLHIRLPGILSFDTILLLASSFTMETARAEKRHGRPAAVRFWVAMTAVFGGVFLAGQLTAWRQLGSEGMYLPSNPYSSFFYMLTAIHGIHLLGGILGLGYLLWRLRRARQDDQAVRLLDPCATYWHFVDGVWIFVYLLLLHG